MFPSLAAFPSGFIFGDYQVVRLIGTGGQSEVYLVDSIQYQRQFAAKVLKTTQALNDEELRIMVLLDHTNIVRLYDFIRTENRLILIFDFCSLGSIHSHIKQNGRMPIDVFKRVGREICDALFYIHSNNIAHRDIKPANILFDAYGHPKLADFGIAMKTDGEKIRQFGGSLPFLPPEIMKRQTHDPFAADMWSLGVTFYYMLTGKLPWSSDPVLMEQEILFGAPNFDDKILPKRIIVLLKALLNEEPRMRLTADEARVHPFFLTNAADEHLPLISQGWMKLSLSAGVVSESGMTRSHAKLYNDQKKILKPKCYLFQHPHKLTSPTLTLTKSFPC